MGRDTLDPRIAGVLIMISSSVFLFVKRRTTGSFLNGRPDGGLLPWSTHVFNLFLLLALNPAVTILLVTRRLEALDPTIVDARPAPLHLGLEIGGLLLYLGGTSLMCWALVTMRGHFQVLGQTPRPAGRLFLSGAYGLVRHPMYASLLGLSLGLASLTQSLAVFTLFLVHAGLILRLVRSEEEGLRRAYGGQYAAYQSRVKKLIPLVY